MFFCSFSLKISAQFIIPNKAMLFTSFTKYRHVHSLCCPRVPKFLFDHHSALFFGLAKLKQWCVFTISTSYPCSAPLAEIWVVFRPALPMICALLCPVKKQLASSEIKLYKNCKLSFNQLCRSLQCSCFYLQRW